MPTPSLFSATRLSFVRENRKLEILVLKKRESGEQYCRRRAQTNNETKQNKRRLRLLSPPVITMCRWISLLSTEEVSLSDVVLAPTNSLVQLARDASFLPGYTEMNNHITNGDGFGVGWYHTNASYVPKLMKSLTPEDIEGRVFAATFRDTQPAWNNQNLRELCMATRSNCIVAHVRAASPFSAVTIDNCHPFKTGTHE